MAKKTVHIPDELHEQVLEDTDAEDSYSAVVQEALQGYIDRKN